MFVEHFHRGLAGPSPRQLQFPVDPLLCKLPPSDQAEFFNLVNVFAYSDDRNKRNMGMSTFVKHLVMIYSFVCRGDSYDSLRGVVCGIEFGLNSFLINTSRLKHLMFRSKSCMNGCFQKLGYTVCRPAHEITSLFAQILPAYGSHFITARHWCVRRVTEASTLCFIPNIKIEIAVFDTPPASPVPACEEKGGDEATPSESFPFDIQALLNRQAPVADIHRMKGELLPPLRC